MTYVVDIDGTICTKTKDGTYRDAKPKHKRIQKINSLYDEGHEIIYYTARGMGRYQNSAPPAFREFYLFTMNQLDSWGVKYHRLMLGKPAGDVYVDDKGIKDEDFFRN